MSTRKATRKQTEKLKFVPDILLTKEDGCMRIVDGPPAALKDILDLYQDGKIILDFESVIGMLFTDWMKKGYSFAFWEDEP